MDVQMIQAMQQSRAALKKAGEALNLAKDSTTKVAGNKEAFSKVFNNAVDASKPMQATAEAKPTEATPLEDVEEVLKTDSLKDLLALLGVSTDDAMMLIDLDGQMIAVDELLDLPNLLQTLGMSEDELTAMLQKLVGEDVDVQAKDVWDLLAIVSDNEPAIQAKLVEALQGDDKLLTPKEAGKFAELMKLLQLAAKGSDLTLNQENKLAPLSNFMSTMLSNVQQAQVVEQPTKPVLPLMAQFVQQSQQTQQAEKQPEQPTQSTTSTAGHETISANTVQTRPNTFQVTLPQTPQAAQSDAFIKEMQAIMNKAQLTTKDGLTRIMIKLYPEHLGSVRVELMQHNGVLTARILAATASGREMLDGQLHQLKQAFVQQNLQVERIDIGQTLQDTDRNNREQGFLNQFFKHDDEEETDDKKKDDEEQKSFEEFLQDEEGIMV